MRHLVKTGAAGAGLALSIMGAALAQQPQGAPPAAAAAPATPAKPSTPPQPDWTTWGYDQERTAWNRGETTLNKDNVSKLKLLWSTQTTTPVSDVALATLTTPLVAMDVRTHRGARIWSMSSTPSIPCSRWMRIAGKLSGTKTFPTL